MPTCFVIQPFDSDRFDKRFDDGWNWIDGHESLFSFRREDSVTELSEDDIPF